MSTQLAEWQVETQHGEAECGESVGHLHEQSGLAVCARTMREDHGVPIGLRRQLQEAVDGGVVKKRSAGGHSSATMGTAAAFRSGVL